MRNKANFARLILIFAIMLRAEFYSINERKNAMNKTLENPTVLNGLFFNQYDEFKPQFQVRYNRENFTFNYVIIDNVAYFIDNSIIDKNGVISLDLSIDVLQTYKAKILAAVGTVVRKSNANNFISNRENIYDVRPQFQKINFSENAPFDENGCLIMITLKGN